MNNSKYYNFFLYTFLSLLIIYIVFPGFLIGILVISICKDKHDPTEKEKVLITTPFYPVIYIARQIPTLGRFYESQINLLVK